MRRMLIASLIVFLFPILTWAIEAALENPGPSSTQSGIGIVSGWKCDAGIITVSFDNGPEIEAAYGTSRADTQAICRTDTTGWVLLWNWNILGNGPHTIRVLDDGQVFASAEFKVVTPGTEFLKGASATVTVPNFPKSGQSATLAWQESAQSFVLVGITGGSSSSSP